MASSNVPIDRAWIERIPKVELHLHLEGAIPLRTLWSLIRTHGGDPEVPDLKSLRERFQFRDFGQFIDTWVWKNRFLRTYEDFTAIAEAVARRLRDQNVRYAEIFFSPGDYRRIGLEPRPLAEAIRFGFSRVDAIEISIIPDLVRDFGPDRAMATLHELVRARDSGLIGFGLGGSEPDFPPEPFERVFQTARDLGFRTTVHAGEAAGPESIWGAVKVLGADRIGHATRAIEDPALVDHLAAHALPIEVCPLSNLRTGVVKRIADHPVRRFFDRGIPISINTDDPTMFNTSLAEEFEALMQVHRFSKSEVKALVLQAAASSFLPDDRKRSLEAELASDPCWR